MHPRLENRRQLLLRETVVGQVKPLGYSVTDSGRISEEVSAAVNTVDIGSAYVPATVAAEVVTARTSERAACHVNTKVLRTVVDHIDVKDDGAALRTIPRAGTGLTAPLVSMTAPPFTSSRFHFSTAQVASGKKRDISFARLAVPGPRSLAYMTPSRLTTNVITPDERYMAG